MLLPVLYFTYFTLDLFIDLYSVRAVRFVVADLLHIPLISDAVHFRISITYGIIVS